MKCPIGCKYCMVDLVSIRASAWNEAGNESIGLNKAACFLNRRPKGRPLSEWAPLELLKGETVGFQGIQDPLDPRWEKDLLWLIDHSYQFGGLILTSKWGSISSPVAEAIAKCSNAVLVMSLTGLDHIEPGSATIDRIIVAEKVLKLGGKVHGLIHPWIAGLSNISWIAEAKKAGISNFTVKGFRWDSKMGDLGISNKYLEEYAKYENEEILIDPPSIDSISLPRFQGNESKEESTIAVDSLMKRAIISSSASRADVRIVAIRRRSARQADCSDEAGEAE